MSSVFRDIANLDELRANPSHPDWEILLDFLQAMQSTDVSTYGEIATLHNDSSHPRWKQLETAFKKIRAAS